ALHEKRRVCSGTGAGSECGTETPCAAFVFGGRKLQREAEARRQGSVCVEEKGSGGNAGEGWETGGFKERAAEDPGITFNAIILPNCNSLRLTANSNSHEHLRPCLHRRGADRARYRDRSKTRGHA